MRALVFGPGPVGSFLRAHELQGRVDARARGVLARVATTGVGVVVGVAASALSLPMASATRPAVMQMTPAITVVTITPSSAMVKAVTTAVVATHHSLTPE